MASKFNETVKEMGYEIDESTDPNVILLQRKNPISDTVILFNKKERRVSGALKANCLLSTKEQMSKQYEMFEEMLEDLKEFKRLSGYDIINY
jgi:hypothetical protein